MVLLIFVLSLLGSVCFYHASKTIKSSLIFSKMKGTMARSIGILMYLVVLFLSIDHFGPTAGILSAFLIIAVIMSSLILFMPLKNRI